MVNRIGHHVGNIPGSSSLRPSPAHNDFHVVSFSDEGDKKQAPKLPSRGLASPAPPVSKVLAPRKKTRDYSYSGNLPVVAAHKKHWALGAKDGSVFLGPDKKHPQVFNEKLDASIYGLTFSPNGKHLVAVAVTGQVKVFDVVSQTCIHTFQIKDPLLAQIRISDDQKHLIITNLDGMRVWDLETGKNVKPVQPAKLARL
jgi:WD40 repeat protein